MSVYLQSCLREHSSVGLEHLPYKQRVGGSTPSAPTRKEIRFTDLFFRIYCPLRIRKLVGNLHRSGKKISKKISIYPEQYRRCIRDKYKKAEQALWRSLRSLFEQLAWRTLPAALRLCLIYVVMCRHQRLRILMQALQSRPRSSAQGLLRPLCTSLYACWRQYGLFLKWCVGNE